MTMVDFITTRVCYSKHQHPWQADYFRARKAFMIAAFNLLA